MTDRFPKPTFHGTQWTRWLRWTLDKSLVKHLVTGYVDSVWQELGMSKPILDDGNVTCEMLFEENLPQRNERVWIIPPWHPKEMWYYRTQNAPKKEVDFTVKQNGFIVCLKKVACKNCQKIHVRQWQCFMRKTNSCECFDFCCVVLWNRCSVLVLLSRIHTKGWLNRSFLKLNIWATA